MWCALVGPNLQEGEAGFGRSPTAALEQLLNKPEVWELTPHAAYEMQCDRCGHEWVAVAPYPVDADGLECSACGHMSPVDQDAKTMAVDPDGD